MPTETAQETRPPANREPQGQAQAQAGGQQVQARIRWDDSNLKSSYANVCNVSSTREEIVLSFGINQAWERQNNDITVQLTDRLILSPFAAKRLAALLNSVITDYENRFGQLAEVQAPRR